MYVVSVNASVENPPLLECWPSADGFAWPRSYWRLLSVPPSVLEILSSPNVLLVQLTGCAAAASSEEGEESPHSCVCGCAHDVRRSAATKTHSSECCYGLSDVEMPTSSPSKLLSLQSTRLFAARLLPKIHA